MRINHNMMAMNAQRQLGINNQNTSKAMEKLSSGLRINRAGDDAAGLAISEKMRGQIRGLNQASRNAQDAVSLIQTAEGALTETHAILQRMRELTVQASNDTNMDEDREQIQKEINELTKEVDRIGNTTEFNQQKLLNAGFSDSENKSKAIQNILSGLKEKGWLELAEKTIKDAFGLEGKGGAKITVEFKQDAGDAAAYVEYNTGNRDLKLAIDLSDITPAQGPSGTTQAGMYADRVIAHEMVHGVMSDRLGADKMIAMPDWFKEGTAEFIHGADTRLKAHIIGSKGLDPTKTQDLIDRAVDLLEGQAWKGDSRDYAAGYLITKYLDAKVEGNSKTFSDFFDVMEKSSLSGDKMVEEALKATTTFKDLDSFKTDFESHAEAYIKTLELNFAGPEKDTGSILGSDHEGTKDINAEDVIDNSKASSKGDQPLSKFTLDWTKTDITLSKSMNIQIGANKEQSIGIELEDMRAESLGISRVDVSTHEKATSAIDTYDQAIKKVSAFRSKLGAYQNRLEHTIKNLDTSSENLQSAESRIRDVDMAKEMMTFTKNNILQQAAQSMLAQANQQPQGVLQLLR